MRYGDTCRRQFLKRRKSAVQAYKARAGSDLASFTPTHANMTSFLITLPMGVAASWRRAENGVTVGELTLAGAGSQLIIDAATKEAIVMSRIKMEDGTCLWDADGVVATQGMDRLMPRPSFDQRKMQKYKELEIRNGKRRVVEVVAAPKQAPDVPIADHLDALFAAHKGRDMTTAAIHRGIKELAPLLTRAQIAACVSLNCVSVGKSKWRLL